MRPGERLTLTPRPPGLLSSSRGYTQSVTGENKMPSRLKPGSMELEAAFIEWLRAQGHSPCDGVDAFFDQSEFVRAQRLVLDDNEKEQLTAESRRYLQQRSRDPTFAGQFPDVHDCTGANGEPVRYTVTLTLSDTGAEWTGRLWSGHEYLGEIHGDASGPHANFLELARSHIEAEAARPGGIAQRAS